MRDQVVRLLKEGLNQKQVAKALGLSTATVCYHVRKAGLSEAKRKNTFDWKEVQKYHDAGHSRLECLRHFGMCSASWDRAAKIGRLVKRDHRIPIPQLLADRNRNGRANIKHRLLKAGLLKKSCYECDLFSWRGKPLSLHLDHKDGDNQNHRLENLRLLCPNCHSQTPTYGGRNIGRSANR